MARKITDKYNRERNVMVGFRVSPEESKLLNAAVALSGLQKREYCYRRCMEQDIIVQGNSRIYKALRDQMNEISIELKRLSDCNEIRPELLENLSMIITILNGMKEDN